jgi:hypothetical protein
MANSLTPAPVRARLLSRFAPAYAARGTPPERTRARLFSVLDIGADTIRAIVA